MKAIKWTPTLSGTEIGRVGDIKIFTIAYALTGGKYVLFVKLPGFKEMHDDQTPSSAKELAAMILAQFEERTR